MPEQAGALDVGRGDPAQDGARALSDRVAALKEVPKR